MTAVPSVGRPEASVRHLTALDWDELGTRLAASAESAAGKALCREPRLARDPEEARRRMAEVGELAALLHAGETLPSLAAPEIEAALVAAEKAVVLGADEVRPVAVLIGIAETARRFFLAGEGAPGSGRPATPEMTALAERLDPPVRLARTIDQTFDASGE